MKTERYTKRFIRFFYKDTTYLHDGRSENDDNRNKDQQFSVTHHHRKAAIHHHPFHQQKTQDDASLRGSHLGLRAICYAVSLRVHYL